MNFILFILNLKALFCSNILSTYDTETLNADMNIYKQYKDTIQEGLCGLEYLKNEIEISVGNAKCISNQNSLNFIIDSLNEDYFKSLKMMNNLDDLISDIFELIKRYFNNDNDMLIECKNDYENFSTLAASILNLFASIEFKENPIHLNLIA